MSSTVLEEYFRFDSMVEKVSALRSSGSYFECSSFFE